MYKKRILALERKLADSRRHLDRPPWRIRYKPESFNREAVKAQLDLVNALIRLTREETAFFVKLGRHYDNSKVLDGLVDLLSARDPQLALDLLHELDRAIKEKEEAEEKD